MTLTRREAMAVAMGAAGGAAFGKASQPATPVSFDVPPGACDCHTHVFLDPARHPFWSGRSYTPETASVEEMAALHRALKMDRVVIVTASVYGTDNAATLEGIRARGSGARGVAVIDENTAERELDAMGRGGIRGVRINLATPGLNDPAIGGRRFRAAASRAKSRGWHVQINTILQVIAAMKDMLRDSPVTVVIDHFGGATAAGGVTQPGFAELVELARSGKAYVKVSSAYRVASRADMSDVAPLAKALIAANPDRILWGTNWPHPGQTPPGGRATDVTPLEQVDDGRVLNLLPAWAPDAGLRKKILVDNPARLYGW